MNEFNLPMINDGIVGQKAKPPYRNAYSEAEITLFSALGFKNLFGMEPSEAYKLALVKEFIKPYFWENTNDKALNALRNAIRVLWGPPSEPRIYRLTPEFDHLIKL